MAVTALAPRCHLATDISVGDHITKKVFGLTVDVDTIWATGAAVLVIVLGLGFGCAVR